ncbi:hypothetical protein AaE_014514 [Aphanomyces astaci]|nr:hypothetical protein AaE_014514 [Aphanomyces astaci]
MLLIQAAADQPFAADKGQVTKAWQTLAETLMASDKFTRIVDAKKVQHRFGLLVDEHRKFDMASSRLSGVDEEETEKHMVLDDILSQLEDVKLLATAKQSATSEDKNTVEQDGVYVREMAMQTLKRRAEASKVGEVSKKKAASEGRRNSLLSTLEKEGERELALRDKELEFKRFKFESDLKQREYEREERKAEREHQLALARIESDKISTLLNAVLESRK